MISNLPVSTASRYSMIDANTIQAIGKMPKAAPKSAETIASCTGIAVRDESNEERRDQRAERGHPRRASQDAEHHEQHENGNRGDDGRYAQTFP